MTRLVPMLACLGCLGALALTQTSPPAMVRPASQPATASKPASAPARLAARELDALEAVCRYLFDHNASAAQRNTPAFFLSINDKDPTPDFLARFKNEKPPVKPGSQFRQRQGIKFTVSLLRWIDADTAEVQGGYYEGNLSAQTNTYRAAFKGDRWVVTVFMTGPIA